MLASPDGDGRFIRMQGQEVASLIEDLEAEVNNGGFHQSLRKQGIHVVSDPIAKLMTDVTYSI